MLIDRGRRLMRLILFSLAFYFFTAGAFAFDQEEISFLHPSNPNNFVSFVFKGKKFDPPLSLIEQKKRVKNPEYRKFQTFFNKLYLKNKEGGKESILSVWHPNDRAELTHQ